MDNAKEREGDRLTQPGTAGSGALRAKSSVIVASCPKATSARYQSAGSGRYCCPFRPASEARNPRSPAVNTQIGAIELSATETAIFVGDSTSNAAGETVSSKPACGTGV